MAGLLAKAQRRADVLQRLSSRLNVDTSDLSGKVRGDPELTTIVTLERIADALESQKATGDLRSVIAAASDDDLIAIPGIGEKSLEALRAWANEPQPENALEDAEGKVTVETVEEKPLKTTETVEIVEAQDAPRTKAKGK